jgi:hypothetical protein
VQVADDGEDGQYMHKRSRGKRSGGRANRKRLTSFVLDSLQNELEPIEILDELGFRRLTCFVLLQTNRLSLH